MLRCNIITVIVVSIICSQLVFPVPPETRTHQDRDEIKASISGCRLLPANNIWNTAIDTLPVDSNSSQYINTIGSSKGVHADFGAGLWDGGPIGIPYITVPGNQPKVNVTFDYDDESDPGPYPIPTNAPIEGGSGSDGDRHILVLDRDNCILYELFYAYPQGDGSWTAGSGAIYDLKSNGLRPSGWTSADAAGLPILPGLVSYAEVASGEIDHALRFTVPKTRKKFIWPARHYASSLTGSQYPPMGQRFRLKAGFDISGYSAKNKVILRALKKYGMILADNGSSWFLSGMPDDRWNNDDLHRLGNVKGSDFEAVDVSSLMISPNSGKALQPGTGTEKTVTVTSPNGGESLTGGTSHAITWTSTGDVGNVKIEYSTNNGSSWTTITSSTANDGSYSWTVPSVSSSNCRVRVEETDGNPSDTSNSVFSIVTVTPTPATITVKSPKGGENWTTGSSHTIKWASTGNVGKVKIQLLKGGSTVLTIASSTGNDGSYNWTLPDNLSEGGNYKIKITDTTDGSVNDSGNNFTITVPSTGGQPVIHLNRKRLNFGAVVSGRSSGVQTFLIGNSGAGTLNWTIGTNDSGWLNTSPSSGSGAGAVEVSVNPNGMDVGSYTGTVTVSASGADNSPQRVTVYLTVKASSEDKPPLGSFDTPVSGSRVRSSVPVTGWALDDVGVESVKLYRQEGNGLKYIGDAVFVEGARTDVESSYLSYPFHPRGGWGYMLLTNFLPDGGNGTFVLYAIARDTAGYETTLGSKTITCDNSNAVKPFGAIDTPVQGGTVSGSSYVNFGWALTPLPNLIPRDGSTIDVVVDGVKLGNPVYNKYRKDIATLFPGYANSNGAVGYFYLDVTAYTNGVHTIEWLVRDDGGNSDGVGSRYFNVRNTGADAGADNAKEKPSRLVIGTVVAGDDGTGRGPDDIQYVNVKKGYGGDSNLQPVNRDKNGTVWIEIKELERLEIHFPHGQTSNLSPLPVGSTLDRRRGIFYWQPGPGFLGEHRFPFIGVNSRGNRVSTCIIIKIRPKNG
ncbi:MAG: hypothetical protein GY940_06140 [bacterium]|nr:hypothetical protein [bacterium]